MFIVVFIPHTTSDGLPRQIFKSWEDAFKYAIDRSHRPDGVVGCHIYEIVGDVIKFVNYYAID